MANRGWTNLFGRIVLFPVLAALALALVSVFRGYLHRQAGFDPDGRPLPTGTPEASPPAAVPPPVPRARKSAADLLACIAADLDRVDASEQPRRRYLTLVHLWNNPRYTDASLEACREALLQFAVYLSRPGRVVVFVHLDRERSVYRLDLDELNWQAVDPWRRVLSRYPYGLSYEDTPDVRLRESEGQIRAASGVSLAQVRADWFMTALTRSPLGGADGVLGLPGGDLPEKVRRFVQGYASQELSREAAAAELGLAGPDPLVRLLQGDARLRQDFGLEDLLQPGTIRRDVWESLMPGCSPFQETSSRLGLGKPLRVQ